MLLVTRQQGQLDLGLPDRDVHALPAVVHLDDVGSLLAGEPRQQRRELAGTIRHSRAENEITARLGQTVARDLDEHGGVDVATGQEAHGPVAVDDAGESAATAAAPAPSTTSFARSSRSTIASAICSSVTVTTAASRSSGRAA